MAEKERTMDTGPELPWSRLDAKDFNSIAFVNSIFPSEESLGQIDRVSKTLREKISQLDVEMSEAVRRQSVSRTKGKEQLQKAHSSIDDLRVKIQEIKRKSEESETMVQEICAEIRELDLGKKNLSNTISALKNLQLFIQSLDSLEKLINQRAYNEIPPTLKSTVAFAEFFEAFHVPQIVTLVKKTTELKATLERAISSEIRSMSDLESIKNDTEIARLRGACDCATILGDSVREHLTNTLCQDLLVPYRREYLAGGAKNDLNVASRYMWLKRTIQRIDKQKNLFPMVWSLPIHLAFEFCNKTREDLKDVLQRTSDATAYTPTATSSSSSSSTSPSSSLDVNQLVEALRITHDFETDLDTYTRGYRIQLLNSDAEGGLPDEEDDDEVADSDDYQSVEEDEDGNFAKLQGRTIFSRFSRKKKTATPKKQTEEEKDKADELRWNRQMERAKMMAMDEGEEEGEMDDEETLLQTHTSNAAEARAKFQRIAELKKREEKRKKLMEKKQAQQQRQARALQSGEPIVKPFVPKFAGMLSSVFTPHLHLFINMKDAELNQLAKQLKPKDTTKDEDGELYHSATVLFERIRSSYFDIKSLSRGKELSDMSAVFMRNLVVYLDTLYSSLPSSVQQLMPTFKTNTGTPAVVTAYAPGLVTLNKDEQMQCCLALNTAMYCYETINQLLVTIKKYIDPELVEMVKGDAPLEKASRLLTLGQDGLSYGSLQQFEDILRSIPSNLSKIPDSAATIISNPSPYVASIATRLPDSLAVPARSLYTVRWNRFIGVFVSRFAQRYSSIIHNKKNLWSAAACQQIQFDIAALEEILKDIPKHMNRRADPTFRLYVGEGFRACQKVLKLVAVPLSPSLPATFLTELSNADRDMFIRLLDLKKVTRDERASQLQKFDEEKAKQSTQKL